MNNKEFVTELSQRTGYNIDSTQRLVRSVVEAMALRFDDGGQVDVPRFGLFEVCNRMERIVVNPSSGQRMIVPPKLVLTFKPVAILPLRPVVEQESSANELASRVVADYGLSDDDAKEFVGQMFGVAGDAIASDGFVKIKGLGTFKARIPVASADNDLADFPGGSALGYAKLDKVTFIPEPALRDRVNSPFAQFVSVALNDGVDFSALDGQDTGETESLADNVGDDVPDAGNADGLSSAAVGDGAQPPVGGEDGNDPKIKENVAEDTPCGMLPDNDDACQEPHGAGMAVESQVEIGTPDEEPSGLEEGQIVRSTTDGSQGNANMEVQDDSDSTNEENESFALKRRNNELKHENFGIINENRKLKNRICSLTCKVKIMNAVCIVMSVVILFMASFIGYCYCQGGLMYVSLAKPESCGNVVKPHPVAQQPEKKGVGYDSALQVKADTVESVTNSGASHDIMRHDESTKPAVAKGDGSSDDEFSYSTDDPRVRTGAYVITGIAKVVRMREGQTVSSISKNYLGPDMECYVGAVNKPGLKPGDDVKIPSLTLKKKKSRK